MKKYEITLAYNLSCYATFEIDADSEEAAIKQAVAEAPDTSFSVDWDTPHCGEKKGAENYINEDYRLVDAIEIPERKLA